MATEFARIKRAVEEEKVKKTQAEARLESLSEEQVRLLKEASELAGVEFKDAEHLEAYTGEMKADIEKKVREMSEILKAEGVAY